MKRVLTCKKQYAGDQEQYGIDFFVGRTYQQAGIEKDGSIYVESKSGTDVMFQDEAELREYFNSDTIEE